MAKIDRYNGNVVAFGSEAEGTERTVFGDTTQSDSLDQNLNSFYKRGFGIVDVNEAPTKQDFNAVNFTNSQLIAYLHQSGIAEWNTNQEYHIGSLANVNGIVYKSKTDNNVGNDPRTDTTNWTTSEPNQIQLLSTYDNGTRTDAEILTAATSAMNTLGKSLIIDQPVDLGGETVDCLGVGLVWLSEGNIISNGNLIIYSPSNIQAASNQQLFDGDVTISFTKKGIAQLIGNFGAYMKEIYISGFYDDGDGGEGTFRWDNTENKANHDGVSCIDPNHTATPGDTLWFSPENTGTGCWIMTRGTFIEPFIITVGTAGRFDTLNAGVEYLSNIKPAYRLASDSVGDDYPRGVRAELLLLSGFIMSEQIIVQSTDLSHIAITAEDSTTIVTRSSLTSSLSGRYPVFGARNATLPLIEALFEMDDTGDAEFRDGVFILYNSTVYVKEDCGVTNVGDRGFHISNTSVGSARGANFSGAGEIGARISNSSYANLKSVNLSNSKGFGISANSSVVSLSEADVSGCVWSGIKAQGALVIAFDVNVNNCRTGTGDGYTGAIVAQAGSTIICPGATINDSGNNAIVCEEATVVAYQQTPGYTITATGATNMALYAKNGVIIADGADLSNAGDIAIYALDNSRISANGATVSGCGDYAVKAENVSTVNAKSLIALNTYGGIHAQSNSTVLGKGMILSNTTAASAAVYEGCNVDITSASFTNVAGMCAVYSGILTMNNVDATRTPAGTYDIFTSKGGIIKASGSTGATNIAVNTLTADGIIFR